MFKWLKRKVRPVHPKYGEPMTDAQIERREFYARLYGKPVEAD